MTCRCVVRADRPPHVVDVGANELAHVRHLVHERDARRQHRVGGVLGQLGAGAVHHHDRRAGARERRVQLEHQLLARASSSAPITTRSGFMKSSTAAPCFRNSGLLTTLNGCVVSRRITSRTALGGAHRHGALVDDDLVAVHRAGDVARHAEHVLQVGGAVFALWRADGDEDDARVADRLGQRRGERQPLFCTVAPDHFLEAGLVDRHLAPAAAPGPWLRPCRRRSRRCRSRQDRRPRPGPRIPLPTTAILQSVCSTPDSDAFVTAQVRPIDDRRRYHTAVMRILVDYRPALRRRTGVGEYMHQLGAALYCVRAHRR